MLYAIAVEQITNVLARHSVTVQIAGYVYSVELWLLSVTQKKLEAAHHKFQRRVPRKDKVRIEQVRQQCRNWNFIIKERRFRWFGHVLRMNHCRLPKQMGGEYYKAKDRKTKNWIHTTRQEAQEPCADKSQTSPCAVCLGRELNQDCAFRTAQLRSSPSSDVRDRPAVAEILDRPLCLQRGALVT